MNGAIDSVLGRHIVWYLGMKVKFEILPNNAYAFMPVSVGNDMALVEYLAAVGCIITL